MPLSKKRDKERKRLARLGNRVVQPDAPLPYVVHPNIYNDLKEHYPGVEKQFVTSVELDAEGNPMPEYD